MNVNNAISSVIKGSSNIAKILFNSAVVWKKITGELPDGYRLCDYLESTGTQYIDTGYIPNSKTRAEVDLQVIDWTTMRANFFGSGDTANSARFNIGMNTAKTKFQWNIADKYLDSIADRTTKRIIIKMDAKNHKLTIDDFEYTNNNPNYSLIDNNTFSFWLFAANGAFKSYMKIFGCRLYDDDISIQDLIPCLDSNDIPCMYDKISKQTFYNQGTGEFKYAINVLYLQLKDFVDGFTSSSTGVVAYNSTYPRAISSPLVLFEKGKTYKLTSNLSATKTDDGVRFRLYGTDDTYKMSLGASQITTNAYATFEALDDLGKSNFYVAKDILITPKQDFKARIMYIDKNYISEFKIEEVVE